MRAGAKRVPGRGGPRTPGLGGWMSTPLYQLKAKSYKTLGHPARIRVLELLSEREYAVAEMLPEVGIEPAHLSQQLAVLRRANRVSFRKEGSRLRSFPTTPLWG